MKIFRILSVLLAVFLLAVVIAADLGLAREWMGQVYALPYGDKAGHFILMGLMSLVLNLGFPSGRVTPLRISRTSLILFTIVALEEASQIFFSNRSVSWEDLSADILGIFLLGEIGMQFGRLHAFRKVSGG